MWRWLRRHRKEIRLAALVLLASAVGFFGRGRWDGTHPRSGDPFPPEIQGAARTIDGDSLWVGSDEVRLKGIDAPEGRQTCQRDGVSWRCGDAARDALRRLIGTDTVICTVSERDRYGRLLAACRAADRNLNAEMVASGMAVAYGDFGREEAAAKKGRLGIWQSEFEMPRQWRDRHNGGRRGG